MDYYTSCGGDAALDLSNFTDCNTSNGDTSQLTNQPLIMLPAGAITIQGSDNVPFYISRSGQLILANTSVERTNEGLVFKQTPPNGLSTLSEEQPTLSLGEPTTFCEEDSFDVDGDIENEEGVSTNDRKILSEKVRRLLDRTNSRGLLQQGEPVVVSGYNLTKLVELAEGLKRYRLSRRMSQAKLSRKIEATAVNALKVSQSFLCRFEKLDLTLRAALGVQPYLEQWLASAECEEEVATAAPDGDATLQNDANAFLPGSNNDADGIMDDLLDLRDRTVAVPDRCALPDRRCRKARSVFDETALAHLNRYFKRNPNPRGDELTGLAEEIGHQREIVRIWFCNRRYQLGHVARR